MNENKSNEERYREEFDEIKTDRDFYSQSDHEEVAFEYYLAGRKAGQKNIPIVLQCPYCEHEASNQISCDINAENLKLKTENERLEISLKDNQNIMMDLNNKIEIQEDFLELENQKLKDLVKESILILSEFVSYDDYIERAEEILK